MYSFIITFTALIIGFFYGSVSVKGQFCMNSGFSNVIRQKDTTKLKSFVVAILIQLLVLPLVFTAFYFSDSTSYLVSNIGLPPLFLIGTAIGGFLFGVFMYYTAGCGAGIFFKIGEKNSGAILAAIGFITGVYLTEKGVLQGVREASQSIVLFNQQPIWKGTSPIIIATIIALASGIALYLLNKNSDEKPSGAIWGWKKTGIYIGILGIAGWISAIFSNTPFGMAIIPGVIDIVDLKYSWGLLFVIGIPLGAFWSTRNNNEKRFTMPKTSIIGKRLLGGLGLGISGSFAAGCTVGHGLTFSPFLGVGSLVGIIFIFLGSGLVGYLTRK
ncbi:MAG: YeeE/YedE family protein [Cyclobacteriaceae bacterium]|nr:YeeE/YedE family protein [Cyclobacteriaceae bacterium]